MDKLIHILGSLLNCGGIKIIRPKVFFYIKVFI
jgi:hypothetical protein